MSITTGTQLYTFLTLLNSGQTIDATLADILIDNAKTILEGERPWAVLMKTDTSKTVTTANTWQTAIDLSTITYLSELYGDTPIQLFDGVNRIQEYMLKPFDQRLYFKDVSNTAVYDENSKTLYLNGTVPFNGTLWIKYKMTTVTIDLTSNSAIWTQFDARFIPLLGYYAIGINKGAIDYDSINRQMLPANAGAMAMLKDVMTKWDDTKQQVAIRHNDPTDLYGGSHRDGAIDIYND